MDRFLTWLERHNLASLHELLVENDIDTDVLGELTEEDLKGIGLSLGQRRRLAKALKADLAETQDGTHALPSAADDGATSDPAVPSAASQTESANAPGEHAERRHVTVMFVDLVGSTEMSTGLDAEDMAAILFRYQNAVSGVISRNGGYIAKFMGDGVLIYFGWPKVREEEPVHALRAGLQIIAAVNALTGPDGSALKVRIGCDSGWVVIGELIGNQTAQERTIVGDTPNMAARVQSEAEPDTMVIGEATQALVGHVFDLETSPPRRLRGFSTPVRLARVVAERSVVSRFESRHEGQRTLPLVGRDSELSLMLDRWRLAVNGEGQAVILVGEAGIGKSRILAEILERVQSVDHDRFVLQCSPNFSDTPMWPVVQMLARVASVQIEDRTADGSDAITALKTYLARVTSRAADYLPALASLLSIPSDITSRLDGLMPARRRAEVQGALSNLLIDNASRKPVLMVLEDAHWADPSTLELFSLLLSEIAKAPILVIVTSRPEGEPAFLSDNGVRLSLTKLGQSAVEELIAHIAMQHTVPSETLLEITDKTDGIPLFVEELTRSVLEAQIDSTRHAMPIPASLNDILMARLDRLSDVHETAQVAACIGRDFDRTLLCAAAEVPAAVVDAALDKMLHAELIYRRGHGERARFMFKHALVRDAAWASLTSRRKVTIHGAILDAMLAEGSVENALIGYHAAAAGRTDIAYDAFLSAGTDAVQSGANAEAILLLRRARTLADQKDEPDRADAQLRAEVALSIPLIAAHGYASAEVETVLTDALSHDPGIVRPEDMFQLKRALWNCRQDQSRLDESLAVAIELEAQAEAAGRGDWMRLACRACGSNLMYLGRLREADAYFRRGLMVDLPWSREETLFEHGEDPEVFCRTYLAWIAALDGRMDDARVGLAEALTASRSLALPIVTAFVGCIEVWILYQRRDAEAAIARADDYIELCRENAFPFWLASFDLMRGCAGVLAGEGQDALDRCAQGLADWKATGALLHVCSWNGVLGNAALAFGDLDLAERAAREGEEASRGSGDRFLLTDVLLVKADLARRRGEETSAVATLEACVKLAAEQGVRLMQLKALRMLAEIYPDPTRRRAAQAECMQIETDLATEPPISAQ